jgi:sigma-B regulation protein RsbU (phosphoserine phosphatase)
VSAAPLYDERGEHIGSFAVVTDIVEMKSLQRQLKEQAEDLRGKNKIMDDELSTARKVQQSLLPHKYPTDSGLEFYVRYLPTLAIGGDFYDIIEIAPGVTGILISDVGGHGVQAALITMIIKTMVETMARQSRDPSTMLSRINEGLVDMFPDESPFITAFYIVIDAVRGKAVYANAGHPYPLLLRKGCGELKELSADGLFWGGYAQAEYQNQELDLKDEDTVLLYTDGLYRLVNEREEELGRDTLYAIINRSLGLGPKELVEKILANIDEFTGRSLELDDICILAVKVNLSQEATFFEPS